MINKLKRQYPTIEILINLFIVVLVSFLYAFTLNFFLVPGHIYSGGVMGFSQLLTYFLNHHTDIGNSIQAGTINMILNIPIILLGFFKLGKKFTTYTLMIVVGISFFSEIIPVTQISENPLLNGVIGGVIAGTAVGLAIKNGMSAGGTDIISMVIYQSFGINIGSINLFINFFIFLGAGFIYTWEFALFTLISMYASAKMIDTIHTNDHRLTVFIVTDRVDAVIESVLSQLRRGITILDGRGGYSKKARFTLMIVVNRYELSVLENAVLEGDPHAFINMVQSTKIIGNFLSKKQQEYYQKEKQRLEKSKALEK